MAGNSKEGLTAETAVLSLSARERADIAFTRQNGGPEDDDEIEQTSADRISEMLTGLEADDRAVVKLYRVAGPLQINWCAEYAPRDFENIGLEGVRRAWGPGEYQIRVYGVIPGSKKMGLRLKQSVTIEKTMDVQTVPAVQTQNTELAQVLGMLAQNQQRMLEALTTRPAAPDPLQQMQTMFGLMAGMREAMGITPQSNQPQKSSISELVEGIRELRSVAKEITPEAEKDEPSLLGMGAQILEIVRAGRDSPQLAQPQAQPGQHTPFPTVQLPPEIQSQQTVPQAEDDQMFVVLKLKSNLKTLVQMAVDSKPVQEGAKFLNESLPDELVDDLYEDDWFNLLCSVAPECEPHREWLEKVRAEAESFWFVVDLPEGVQTPES